MAAVPVDGSSIPPPDRPVPSRGRPEGGGGGGSPGGCLTGCFGLILLVLFIWALIFGVTINGEHHEIRCSCGKGVEAQ